MHAQKFSTNYNKQDKTSSLFGSPNQQKRPCKPTFAEMLKRGPKYNKTIQTNERKLNLGEQANTINELLNESNKFISFKYGFKLKLNI